MIEPTYLGDGVYATAEDDGSFMLTTGHHEQLQADAVIFLEPEIMAALDRYRERVKEWRKTKAIDHIDGDVTNNDPANLRVVTLKQNMGDPRR